MADKLDSGKVPRFKSDYGMLDVLSGRHALARHLVKHGPVRVMIEAEITEPFGSDDGTSIAFNLNVKSVKVATPLNPSIRGRA